MILAGLDQSLTGTGICIYDTTQNSILFVTSLKREGRLRGISRLLAIKERVIGEIERYGASNVFMEGYSYRSRGKVFELGELGGILKLSLYTMKLPFFIVLIENVW